MPKAAEKSNSERVLEFVRRSGVIRPRDLDALKIPREYLRRLHAAGMLKRPSRGIYVAADAELTEHQSLAEASKRVPHGVVCLLSAIEFHDLGTQIAHEVWMAIGSKCWAPRSDYPPLRFVRFSEATLRAGVEQHRLGGVAVKIFSPAKTVADCFKYRNKIGLDVALEALRDYWRKRRATMDDLCQAGQVCRVANVMRPYLESLT